MKLKIAALVALFTASFVCGSALFTHVFIDIHHNDAPVWFMFAQMLYAVALFSGMCAHTQYQELKFNLNNK